MRLPNHQSETVASNIECPLTTAQYDDKQAKLTYMAELLLELRRLAQGIGEGTLVYLIEMAAIEANDAGRLHRFRQALLNEHDPELDLK